MPTKFTELGGLTIPQAMHLERIKGDFLLAVTAKYTKGAVEHGGNLIDMDVLSLINNAMDECIDQWTYLHTLKERLTK